VCSILKALIENQKNDFGYFALNNTAYHAINPKNKLAIVINQSKNA
jgi:hypothetical protein